jgi:hypothetical protein
MAGAFDFPLGWQAGMEGGHMRRLIGGVLVAAAAFWGSGPAQAGTVGDGKMKIDFSDEMYARVIEEKKARVGAWGRAHYDAEHFRFYLPAKHATGGHGNGKAAVAEYEGGMHLAIDGWMIELGDFIVDRDAKQIKSTISAWKDGDARPTEFKDVPIFDLKDNPHGAHALAMAWTPAAAGYFGYMFDDDAWQAGDLAATGNIDMEVVPIPAALPLLATALGGLGVALHRRRRPAA